MPHLYLPASGLQFTFEELKLLPKATELSDYEKAIVQFCYHWLNQQQAFTVYTSGSTGNPKPISIKRKQMQLSAELTVKALHIKSNEHVFSCLHVRHIAGKMMLVRGLEFNLPITAVEPAANPLQQFQANHPFEFASFVPLQVQSILEQADGASKLNRFKHILVGGAPITSYQEQLFQSLEVPIFHTYGMSETVSHIALRRVNGEKKSDQFKTLDHVEISLDERKCL